LQSRRITRHAILVGCYAFAYLCLSFRKKIKTIM